MPQPGAFTSSLKFVEECKSEDSVIGWTGPETTTECGRVYWRGAL